MDNTHKVTNLFPHIKMLKPSPLHQTFTSAHPISARGQIKPTFNRHPKNQHPSIHGEIPVKIR